MSIQYIHDGNGQTTAVIIPIAEWKDITDKHQDLKELDKDVVVKKVKPSDFAGTLSDEAYDAINEHITQSRNEWDRNF